MELNENELNKYKLFMKVAGIHGTYDMWSEIDQMFRVEFELEPMEFDKAVEDAVNRWTHYLTTRRLQDNTQEYDGPRRHTWINSIVMGAFDPIDDKTSEFLGIESDRTLSVRRFFKFWIDYSFWDIYEDIDGDVQTEFPLRVFLDRKKPEDNFWHAYIDNAQ